MGERHFDLGPVGQTGLAHGGHCDSSVLGEPHYSSVGGP